MAKKNRGINIFRHVPKANLPRTEFPLQHTVTFDGDFGYAYPFLAEDVIATDTWHLATRVFMRLNPLIAPAMTDLRATIHWFFVPTRLVWKDCEEWYTGGIDGVWREDHPDSMPWVQLKDYMVSHDIEDTDQMLGSLYDFFGLNFNRDRYGAEPISAYDIHESHRLSALYPRSYWLIEEYYFRDLNISGHNAMYNNDDALSSGEATEQEFLPAFPFKVCWNKDYFTSAQLTPQRGPQVYVPLGQNAPIINTISASPLQNSPQNVQLGTLVQTGSPESTDEHILSVKYSGRGTGRLQAEDTNGLMQKATINADNFIFNTSQLEADLTSVPGTPIDDIRESFALQRLFERLQVVGSRFAEYLRGIFGSDVQDYRLQMPEYLGTTVTPIVISNVPQNSQTTTTSPQGSFAGNGMGASRSETIHKYFPEPGIIMGLFVVMPRNGYQQGLAKKLVRFDYTEHFNPYLQHIGEQPVMTNELLFDPCIPAVKDTVFGYQSQYASYKFINSSVHGNMKKNLSFWTSNRQFDSVPTLSDEFIRFQGSESTDRMFALTEEPKFEVEIYCDITVDRPISPYSTPSIQ